MFDHTHMDMGWYGDIVDIPAYEQPRKRPIYNLMSVKMVDLPIYPPKKGHFNGVPSGKLT